MNSKQKTTTQNRCRLVNGKQLLALIFEAESRPTRYWLRAQTGTLIPGRRIGGRYFYDPDEVRATLFGKTPAE